MHPMLAVSSRGAKARLAPRLNPMCFLSYPTLLGRFRPTRSDLPPGNESGILTIISAVPTDVIVFAIFTDIIANPIFSNKLQLSTH